MFNFIKNLFKSPAPVEVATPPAPVKQPWKFLSVEYTIGPETFKHQLEAFPYYGGWYTEEWQPTEGLLFREAVIDNYTFGKKYNYISFDGDVVSFQCDQHGRDALIISGPNKWKHAALNKRHGTTNHSD